MELGPLDLCFESFGLLLFQVHANKMLDGRANQLQHGRMGASGCGRP
jgi:hypothetical protein